LVRCRPGGTDGHPDADTGYDAHDQRVCDTDTYIDTGWGTHSHTDCDAYAGWHAAADPDTDRDTDSDTDTDTPSTHQSPASVCQRDEQERREGQQGAAQGE
jgi:hypothetical protein